MHHIIIINANILHNYSHSVLEFELVIEIVYIIIIYFLYTTLSYIRRYTDTRTTCSSYAFPPLPLTNLCPWDYPPVYFGIHRIYSMRYSSPVVRFVGRSYRGSCSFILCQFPWGILVTILLYRWGAIVTYVNTKAEYHILDR